MLWHHVVIFLFIILFFLKLRNKSFSYVSPLLAKTDKSQLKHEIHDSLHSLFLQLLEMLALLTFLFFPGYLCLSCDDFTVSFCSPDPSQTILSLDLPNMGYQWRLCERLCNVQEDCEYWSVSCPEASEPCKCFLLKYSYLHSCEVIGGGIDSDIEVLFSSMYNVQCDPKRLYIVIFSDRIRN